MKLQTYLDELVALEGVKGAVISLRNGLLAASSFKEPADENAMAAMSAVIFDTMSRQLHELGLGTVVDSLIETDSCSVQIAGLGNVVLVVVAKKRTDVKQIRLHLRRIAKELAERNT